MPATSRELAALRDAVDAAYQQVRSQVLDRLPPPKRIDLTVLSERQLRAVEELERAEADLARYRQRAYG